MACYPVARRQTRAHTLLCPGFSSKFYRATLRGVLTNGTEGSMYKRQKGFSLIELLIVVTIILIISAIAIPSLTHSRMQANEAAAVGALKALTESSVMYLNSYGGEPPFISNMGPFCGGPHPSSTAGAFYGCCPRTRV